MWHVLWVAIQIPLFALGLLLVIGLYLSVLALGVIIYSSAKSVLNRKNNEPEEGAK